MDSLGEERAPCINSKFIAGTERNVFVITETGVFPGTSIYLPPKFPKREKGLFDTQVMDARGKYLRIVPTVNVPQGPLPTTRKGGGIFMEGGKGMVTRGGGG